MESCRALALASSACAVHEIVVSTARRLSEGGKALLILNDEQDRPVVQAAQGIDPALLDELRGRPLASVDEGIARAMRGAAQVVTTPLRGGDRISGVLVVEGPAGGSDEAAWFLSALADQAMVALASLSGQAPRDVDVAEDPGGAARARGRPLDAHTSLDVERERYRLLSRARNDPVWDWDIRTNLIERNDTFYEVFRYSPEQISPTLSWWVGRIHPEDRERVERSVYEMLRDGGELWSDQYRIYRGDGSIARVFDRGCVLRDAAGTPVRMVGTTVDLTEQFQMQDALRDREDRLRLATWAADVGTWRVDLGTWLDTRDASLNRILGLEERETTQPNSDWINRVHEDDRDAVRDITRRCLSERCVYDIVHRIIRPDGEIRWVHDRGRLICDQEGAPLFLTGAVVDITERKHLEEERAELLRRERMALAQSERDRRQAEEANRMKDEFLAIVSHELRTPLTAILGWARLIMERDLDPDRFRQGMAAIVRNTHAQAQIVDDILTVSRIITGKLRLNTTSVDVAAVVNAAVDTIAPTATAKEIAMCVLLDADLGRVSGDPDRLQQVVWNLLSNAVKFTPKRGRVTVRAARSHDSQVVISVTDSGKGIDRSLLPYIFDRFRQGDSSATRAHGGLGLGLSIVRNLVELHGGTVEAASEGEGRGASFTVTLPLQASPRPADDGRSSPSPRAACDGESCVPLAGLRVLVVEDEPDARDLLAFVLEQAGAHVTTTGSMREAMSALEQQRPDVLVSDICMPGESGYALIKQMRANGRDDLRSIPAVALTAYAGVEDRRRAVAAGFQRHVAKPIDPCGLVKAVAGVVGRA